jgi:inner membrane protein
MLWAFAKIACLVKILLDWTNNYGVRPFFPFDPRWYAGSFVFLFEPVIFAVLLVGLVAPAIFGMADREIGVRRPRFRGQGWAIFALSAVVLVWCWRWAEHRIALDLLAEHPLRDDVALRACANPFPITPYRWYVVVEYPDRYQTAIVDTRTGEVRTNPSEDTYYKSPQTPAVLAADRSWLGRVYLDWSQFPWITEDSLSDPTSGSATVVRFRDLRFAYPVLSGQKRHHAPLGGSVTVGPQGQIEEMEMGGHVQH